MVHLPRIFQNSQKIEPKPNPKPPYEIKISCPIAHLDDISKLNKDFLSRLINDDLKILVIDGFIDKKKSYYTHKLLTTASSLSSSVAKTHQISEIRTDSINFLPAAYEGNEIIKDVISKFKCLANRLNGIYGKEIAVKPPYYQLSKYGPGDKYIAHTDNNDDDDDALWMSDPSQKYRYLTCITYFTPSDWNSDRDGGVLRGYYKNTLGDGYKTIEVEPRSGRLVIFLSKILLHEVLPPRREGRFAITGWMLNYRK